MLFLCGFKGTLPCIIYRLECLKFCAWWVEASMAKWNWKKTKQNKTVWVLVLSTSSLSFWESLRNKCTAPYFLFHKMSIFLLIWLYGDMNQCMWKHFMIMYSTYYTSSFINILIIYYMWWHGSFYFLIAQWWFSKPLRVLTAPCCSAVLPFQSCSLP